MVTPTNNAGPAPYPLYNPLADDASKAMDSGESVAEAAFLANCDAVQGYSTALMGLSEGVEKSAENLANYYINTVLAQDETNISTDAANGNTNAVTSDQTTFTIHNTQYNQTSSFFSGLDNGVNQNSSDTTQTLQLDLTMYQSGPLSQQQVLTQVI